MQMPGAMLVGPQLSRVDLTMGSRMLVIMVGFRPGALHRLLRIPMHELLNLPLDAKLIFGSEVDDVSEQLQGATGFAQMVEIVERFLLRKSHLLKPALPLEAVLANLKAEGPISQLAAQACVSIRQLERQFNERIGMTPKTYARLLRFSRAWILHERFPQLPWISIAHSCHYADQMHLIRDFKAFTGVSPRQLQGPDADSLRLQAETFD